MTGAPPPMPLGVKRLDELLAGGLPDASATLLFGPPFAGRKTLSKLYLIEGMRRGVPGIMVLTDATAADVRAELAAMAPDYAELEYKGLMRFVDTFSTSIGAEDDAPNVEYVDGPIDLSAVSLALNNAQRKLIQDHPRHRLVFRSVSTLMAYTNAQTTFRFLQVFLGKAKRAGATTMLHLDQGMHADAEIQMIKHLVDGVIAMRSEAGKHLLHVEGLGVTEDRGWVEYHFTDRSLDITGSFAGGRIR